jgi:pimeloyl-ACP methyl ester carboxylesterase
MRPAAMQATLWAACRVFVPLVLIANLAVEAVPHARGIAFPPQLRYAVVTPACALGAGLAVCLYRVFQARSGWPRWMLNGCLALLVMLVLILLDAFGPAGLVRQAAFPVLVVAVALAFLVPRAMGRPSGRVGRWATVVFGGLAVLGVVAAFASERVGPPGPDGLAFDIPRTTFDVAHKFMDLPNGTRIHYVDEGAGETLLFLHGNPGWSFQWRELVHGLKGSYRCVVLDYPGFGLSSAPAGYGYTAQEQRAVVEAFVDHLGLHDLTLVMQDWGGPIGLGLAERRPELVRRLVLGNTWAWPTSTSTPRGKFSKLVGGPVGEFIQMNFNGFTAAALSHDIARKLPADVAAIYRRPFRPLDRRGVAAFYPGQITAASAYFTELEAGLPRIRDRRTLILWGMRDPGFPRADLERHERAFPNHTPVELPEAGHFFFEDAPEQVLAHLRAFLAGEAISAAGSNPQEKPHGRS